MLAEQVRNLKELKIMADELTAEITALEDAIKAELIAAGKEEMTVDVYKVRYTAYTSSRFDSKAFKAAQPPLSLQAQDTAAIKALIVETLTDLILNTNGDRAAKGGK